MSNSKRTLNTFCNVALIEGISMVVLVVFSVLKRTTDYEWAVLGVKYIGWAHGLLFIAYVYLLWMCADRYKWKFSRVGIFFIASLIPFAPFFVERQLRHEK
jgi:integral membrane protein